MKLLRNLILAATLLLMPSMVWAEGSVTQTFTAVNTDVVCLTFSWTGDSVTGSVPATESTTDIDGWVIMVVTNPGTTPPTDSYDIVLTDADGVDIMANALLNRDSSNSEVAWPISGPEERFIDGAITMTISNQSEASATGDCKVYYRRR
jgi:hypothetical protein